MSRIGTVPPQEASRRMEQYNPLTNKRRDTLSIMSTRKRAEGIPRDRPSLIRVVRECSEEMTRELKSKRSGEELVRQESN